MKLYRLEEELPLWFLKEEEKRGEKRKRVGISFSYGFHMGLLGLPGPPKSLFRKKELEFYFTKKGLKKFGFPLVKIARKRGQKLFLKTRSLYEGKVVFSDPYQVAFLLREREEKEL